MLSKKQSTFDDSLDKNNQNSDFLASFPMKGLPFVKKGKKLVINGYMHVSVVAVLM